MVEPLCRRSLGRFVFATVTLLVAAGCGSQHRLSKSEYAQKVRTAYAPVQAAFLATKVGLAELPDRVSVAQDRLRQAANQLEDVEPPVDVEREHEELVEGLRRYAHDLDALRTPARRGDGAAVESFSGRIPQNEAVQQIAEAAEEMKFKGYDLGRLAEG